jgi:hypothetical protein
VLLEVAKQEALFLESIAQSQEVVMAEEEYGCTRHIDSRLKDIAAVHITP